jgi:histidyl-tRNA synthetase
MKKQMNYANSRNIPFVLIAGEEERRKGEYTIKDMKTGEQSGLTLDALLEKIH